jgi:hypothetical protein
MVIIDALLVGERRMIVLLNRAVLTKYSILLIALPRAA